MYRKIDKRRAKSLQALLDLGGVVMSSAWTNGQGRHTTRRAVPPLCEVFSRYSVTDEHTFTAAVPAHVVEYLQDNPRVQRVVAVRDEEVLRVLLALGGGE